jgi:uncharacterized protein
VPSALPAHVHVWVEPAEALLALAETADTAASRTRGLLGRDGLAPGHGLILDPCRLIHTFFMRFAIDVVFVDRRQRVTRVARDVQPFRFAWGGWSARVTLELPAGTLARVPVAPGAQLRLERVP